MTRWVLGHRRLVILVWLVLAAAGIATVGDTIDRLSQGSKLPGRPGQQANDLIRERFGGTGGRNAPLLVEVTVPEGRRADEAEVRDAFDAAVRRATPPGGRHASFATTGDPALISADGRTAVALVYPPGGEGPKAYGDAPARVRAAVAGIEVAGAPVRVTGRPLLSGRDSGAARSPIAETLLGALGALVVLGLTFAGGLALIPLLTAAIAIPTTFLLVGGLTRVTDVSFIVQYLVALIGLGIAIDYALLVVTRWREERDRVGGADPGGPDPGGRVEAIVRAATTAGRAVLLSGATVALSLAALVVLPVPFLRSVGYAGLLMPLVSVAVTLTLLPVLLYVCGARLDVPRRTRRADGRAWSAIARATTRRPVLAAVLGGALLLALAAPALTMRVGQPQVTALGRGGEPARVFAAIERAGFGTGIAQPIEVATDGDAKALARRLAAERGVAGAIAPAEWDSGGLRVVEVWTATDPATDAGRAAVGRVLAAARATPGVHAGGGPAQDRDFADAVYGSLPLVLSAIAVLTFLVLMRSLRSIWLPVKALVLNTVSVAAAYGAVVLIWQKGYGSELLFDTPATGAITVWVPMAVFAFLFGLSMDYEVFILTRIREAHLDLAARGVRDTTEEAVVIGIGRTGRLVTSAALILFLAFVALSTVPVTDVKILATALAVGIVVDATIVRGVLAPALVTLMGRANWWFPHRAHGPRGGRDVDGPKHADDPGVASDPARTLNRIDPEPPRPERG
ncbi:MMPL family transporter [Embleya sp. NPDC020630]|uniref:MMPL family transporter n=1 Tax=Embleya sp. NPDC020630 TaxID=3363979 RepID=UPI003793CBF8